MKRSRNIRLILLGTAGLITLGGCDDAGPVDQAQFFTDAQACESAYDADACRKALAESQSEHVKTAPKFANREACEAEHGAAACVEAPKTEAAAAGGGSWFMPAMMGFMMGRMMSGGYASAPVYRDRSGTAFSSGGRALGPASAIAGRSIGQSQPAARQGFGSTGARSSAGS